MIITEITTETTREPMISPKINQGKLISYISHQKVLFDTKQEMELSRLPLVRTPFCVIVKLVIGGSENFVNFKIFVKISFLNQFFGDTVL